MRQAAKFRYCTEHDGDEISYNGQHATFPHKPTSKSHAISFSHHHAAGADTSIASHISAFKTLVTVPLKSSRRRIPLLPTSDIQVSIKSTSGRSIDASAIISAQDALLRNTRDPASTQTILISHPSISHIPQLVDLNRYPCSSSSSSNSPTNKLDGTRNGTRVTYTKHQHASNHTRVIRRSELPIGGCEVV
jgi:hypothetical protein